MDIKYYKGDIFASPYKVYAHGTNCMGVMGAGIAKQIKDKFPTVFKHYKEHCGYGFDISGSSLMLPENDYFIFNCFSQINTGANATVALLRQSLKSMIEYCISYGIKNVAMPMIGTGIGGLSVDDFNEVINYLLRRYNKENVTLHIVKEYEPDKFEEILWL